MRRIVLALAVAALASLSLATPAAACPTCFDPQVSLQTPDGRPWSDGKPVTVVVSAQRPEAVALPPTGLVVVMRTDGDRTKCLEVPLKLLRSDGAGATYAGIFYPFRAAAYDGKLRLGDEPSDISFDVGRLAALALLNHATKYRIATELGDTQVATWPEAGRLYVLDGTDAGARLRSFDVASGAEQASRLIANTKPAPTGIGHGTLAVDRSTGAVFALLREGPLATLEEFDGATLHPVRRVLGDLRCGDRIVAAAGRVAMACLGEGGLVVSDKTTSVKFGAKTALVGITMAPNGALFGAAADGQIVRLAPGASGLESIDALRERGSRVVPDGIVAQADCCLVVALLDRVANTQVRIVTGGFTLVLFPESTPPSGRVLFPPPFPYYTVGAQARHVDVQQGFGEAMTSFTGPVFPGAVADR